MAAIEPPLQVSEIGEVRDRIRAIAEREKLSQAAVVRSLIRMSLVERERMSEALTADSDEGPGLLSQLDQVMP